MLLLEPWLTNVEPTMVPRPWVKWAVLTRAQDVSAAFMHAIAAAIRLGLVRSIVRWLEVGAPIDPPTVPDTLRVNAHTAEGEIMGVRHKDYPIHGVQFHPESILTRHGKDLLKNFLRITSDFHAKKKAA